MAKKWYLPDGTAVDIYQPGAVSSVNDLTNPTARTTAQQLEASLALPKEPKPSTPQPGISGTTFAPEVGGNLRNLLLRLYPERIQPALGRGLTVDDLEQEFLKQIQDEISKTPDVFLQTLAGKRMPNETRAFLNYLGIPQDITDKVVGVNQTESQLTQTMGKIPELNGINLDGLYQMLQTNPQQLVSLLGQGGATPDKINLLNLLGISPQQQMGIFNPLAVSGTPSSINPKAGLLSQVSIPGVKLNPRKSIEAERKDILAETGVTRTPLQLLQQNPKAWFYTYVQRPLYEKLQGRANSGELNTAFVNLSNLLSMIPESMTPMTPDELANQPAWMQALNAVSFGGGAAAVDDFIRNMMPIISQAGLKLAKNEVETVVEDATKGIRANPERGGVGFPEELPKKVPEVSKEVPKVEGAAPPIKPPEVPKVATGEIPPEKAGNIRLNKFNEDVRPVIKDWADAHPAEVEAARRGKIPDAQVRLKAEQLIAETGGDLEKLRAEWKPGVTMNAEEVTALRGALSESTQKVLDLQKLVKENGSTENLLKLQDAIQEQVAIQESVHGVTAETGRALRAFRQSFNEAAGDEAKMAELLKRIGGKAHMEDVAKMLETLDINDPIAVNKFLQSLQKPKLSDYLTELYYNSILSGPKTHIVNALSNSVNSIISPIERAVAAGVDLPLSAIQGRPRARFLSEVPADVFGAIHGTQDGFRQYANVIRNGDSLEAISKWEMRTQAFKGRWGTAINLPSRELKAADELMHAINYQSAIDATAHRMASMEKLTGKKFEARVAELLANPTPELMAEAEKVARYRLFQQPLGKFGRSLMNARNAVDINGLQPGRFLVPFIQTPMNLVKFGLERTPLGFANPKLWGKVGTLATKNPEAADQLARAIIGTIGVTAVVSYAKAGLITGALPRSPAERERFYREGKQPYAVRVGEFWVSYQRLEPFNQLFSQAAIIVDGLKNGDRNVTKRIEDAANTFGQNFVSQTYMSSLSDALNMLAEPERYAGNWLNKFASAMAVPMSSASRTAAQWLDDTVRDPQNAWETIQTNIPGLSKNIQPKLTAMGEEVKRKSPPWFPINVTPVEETVLSQELERLKYNIGEATNTISNVKLTDKEKLEYQKSSGEAIKKDLEKLMTVPLYWTSDDDQRRKMIAKVIDTARDTAKLKIRQKMYASGAEEERFTKLAEGLKNADSNLGKNLSGIPEFSFEKPNIYDVAHELDDAYKSLLGGVTQIDTTKIDLAPSAISWLERQRTKEETKNITNHRLFTLNPDNPEVVKNLSRTDLELLRQYSVLEPKTQKKFLKDNPTLTRNPYEDYLKANPLENANLAVWGDADILTKKAWDKAQELLKELDFPPSTLPEGKGLDIPPNAADDYFKYLEMDKSSPEAKLLLAQNKSLLKYVDPDGKISLPPTKALELMVKHKAQYDEIEALKDETSDKYIADEIARNEAIKKIKQGEFLDDLRRIEAYEKNAPESMIEPHVKYMQILDKPGVGDKSAEAMLFRVDNAEYNKWRQDLQPIDESKIPIWRIDVKYAKQDDEYSAIKNPVEKDAYLDKNREYWTARLQRDAYEKKLPEPMVNKYVTYGQMPVKGYRQERYLKQNPDLAQALGKDISKPIPSEKYDILNEKMEAQDAEYEKLIGATAKEDYLAKDPKYANDRHRRDAYKAFVPDDQIEKYVLWKNIPTGEGNQYQDEWFMMDNPDFYNVVYKGLLGHAKMDFLKVPTREVYGKYQQYQALGTTQARTNFRIEHPDLEEWGELALGWKPLGSKPVTPLSQTNQKYEELLKRVKALRR